MQKVNMKSNRMKGISITIKSVLLGLGFYFLIRVLRNNYYFPIILSLKESNPPIYQILIYVGHTFFFVGLLLYFHFVKEDAHCLKYIKINRNSIIYILLGLACGFALNGINILIAFIHGDIDMVHSSFNPYLLIVSFLVVLFQATVEEMQYRMWIQKRIAVWAPLIYAILGSSFAFGWSHMLNMGMSIIALINIFLHGILYSLLLEITGDIWFGSSLHAAWNFTQNFIFGLPNSGYKAMLTIMEPTFTKSSVCYDPDFGVEGTIVGVFINIIIIIIVYIIYKKFFASNKSKILK